MRTNKRVGECEYLPQLGKNMLESIETILSFPEFSSAQNKSVAGMLSIG